MIPGFNPGSTSYDTIHYITLKFIPAFNAGSVQMFYVYILTNKTNSVFYIGCTDNLQRRIFEHKIKELKGFTSKYNLNKLIWFKEYDNADEAFRTEYLMKRWKREWKEELIGKMNSEYADLSKNWY